MCVHVRACMPPTTPSVLLKMELMQTRSFHAAQAKQGGLVDEWCGELDELVQQATAGVPRLILFTMRALHHLRALYPDKVQLDSKEAIAAALNEVYLQLNSLGIIDNEVAGGPVVRSKFLLPWLWLQLVAKVGAWVDPTWDLPFEGLGLVSPTLDRILGDVPFFAAQHHDGKIRLGRAGFAEVAARATIFDKLGAGADAVYDWQLLERRVVAALRLLVAVAHHSRQTWGEACSFLDHNDVPKDVREERVLVPDCGMLAPVQELSEVFINPLQQSNKLRWHNSYQRGHRERSWRHKLAAPPPTSPSSGAASISTCSAGTPGQGQRRSCT